MKLRKFLWALILALFSLQTLNFTALADEGMWPFNNVPRAEIKKKYGFDVTDEWLRKVQLASVRFNNGGSGSFVSPNGLVLTNYHIVEDIVNDVSTPQKDLAKEGFVARTPAEEIKAPSLELNVLMSIEDVTARVNGAVKSGMSDAQAFAARRAENAAIEAESTKATGLRSDVITLYQGAQYNLYRYKKYTDVRLVFVPEFQAAFFGGDPDNFNFPRFNIDMALVRVYENDQPVHPPSYFKWSTTGAKEGDLVFVTGNPGSTSRLNTIAHLQELRDTSIPMTGRNRMIATAPGDNTSPACCAVYPRKTWTNCGKSTVVPYKTTPRTKWRCANGSLLIPIDRRRTAMPGMRSPRRTRVCHPTFASEEFSIKRPDSTLRRLVSRARWSDWPMKAKSRTPNACPSSPMRDALRSSWRSIRPRPSMTISRN